MTDIKQKKVAVLATDGFEQVELTEPVKALRAAGATVTIVSLKPGEIQGMNHHEKGDKTKVDLELSKAKAEGLRCSRVARRRRQPRHLARR